MKATNCTNDKELAGSLQVADSLLQRMKGLLGRKTMSYGEGLWIRPCMGVHTFGMHFPIDILFLDREQVVIASKSAFAPNRLTPVYVKAASVLELPAGIIEKTATNPGDRIALG
jgi:uncharacterized membrane protein (UPF0127 family)